MPRPLIAAALLMMLASCSQKEAGAPANETESTPQIASLDDYAVPVDKSDQITAIDAATGDAGGMPRDGGAVIVAPKPEPRPAVVAGEARPADTAAAPVLAVPPAAPAPSPAAPPGN